MLPIFRGKGPPFQSSRFNHGGATTRDRNDSTVPSSNPEEGLRGVAVGQQERRLVLLAEVGAQVEEAEGALWLLQMQAGGQLEEGPKVDEPEGRSLLVANQMGGVLKAPGQGGLEGPWIA